MGATVRKVPFLPPLHYALLIIATLFNIYPYISSSGTPVGTKFNQYCYLNVGIDVIIMWLWYVECISLCGIIFVCVLCQPVHSLSHPYISQISFYKTHSYSKLSFSSPLYCTCCILSSTDSCLVFWRSLHYPPLRRSLMSPWPVNVDTVAGVCWAQLYSELVYNIVLNVMNECLNSRIIYSPKMYKNKKLSFLYISAR